MANIHKASEFRKLFNGIPVSGVVVRVFASGPGDLGSIPDLVIPKT